TNTTAEREKVLLNETPGHLSSSQKSVFDHLLPNIYLTESRNAAILASENPFTVYNGWFSEQRKLLQFSIPSIENTPAVALSFQAPERHGNLIITLNGNLIFNGPISTQNVAPILLPRSLLQSTNTLEFAVTGGFFQTRRYSLTDIKIIADITDTEKQQAVSSFTLSENEFDNLESAYLEYLPLCDQGNVGVLTLELNGRIVHSGTPGCDSLNREDLFVDDFKQGKNIVTFKLNTGSYRLEQVRARTVLKPVKTFIDYFSLKEKAYERVRDGADDIILHIEFVDDEKTKQAQVNINGRYDIIDQKGADYEREISSFVREGNNYLEIKPLTELNIARVEVRVE
ncbi:hypothetical protein J4211_02710, partial [Candidatus Woesearchaeota archaeon]|nr:hypothetical protein [Candidatus Woesearchaeota archaeon]